MTSSFESTTFGARSKDFEPDRAERAEPRPAPASASAGDARDDAERAEAAAFERGRAEGLAAAREDLEPALRALTTAANEISDLQRAYLSAQRRFIVDLAIEIAEHVVGRAVAANPDMIVERIQTALAHADGASELRVELNPEDHALVSRLDEAPAPQPGVELVESPGLRRGETIVTNGRIAVDARHRSLLGEIREALLPLDSVAVAEAPGGPEA